MKIGVFDSGLGGLTVVESMSRHIKGADIFYIADTLNSPYGEKTQLQILDYSLKITEYFINNYQIDALVIACNTATSAAIKQLRETFPDIIFVGAEPAIKPAIKQTKSGKIGVLATPATLAGDKYQTLLNRLSCTKEVEIFEQACPGLVEHIESNTLDSKESIVQLHHWLSPMKQAGVDTIVLGCTHYPLASKYIRDVMGDEVILMASGKAITKHLLSLMEAKGHDNSGENTLKLYTTGMIDKGIVHHLAQSTMELIVL